jgi:hypothetical protein
MSPILRKRWVPASTLFLAATPISGAQQSVIEPGAKAGKPAARFSSPQAKALMRSACA